MAQAVIHAVLGLKLQTMLDCHRPDSAVKLRYWVLSLYSLMVTLCTTMFNIQNFRILPTELIYIFVQIPEQTATASIFNLDWLVCVTKKVSTVWYKLNS